MNATDHNFALELFFDGECPLCTREINLLRRLDRKQRILFTDLAAPDFDAMQAAGVPWQTLMDRIHARLPDGTLIAGVEVFRVLYTTVGFGRIVALTRLPGVSQALELAYTLFARHRLRFGGRCSSESCVATPN